MSAEHPLRIVDDATGVGLLDADVFARLAADSAAPDWLLPRPSAPEPPAEPPDLRSILFDAPPSA